MTYTEQPPTLPSANPSKISAMGLIGISTLMLVASIGLIGSSISIYHSRGQARIYQADALTDLEQSAELRQKEAQLSRRHDAPLWLSHSTYQKGILYEVEGSSETEIPVLMGHEIDTAVCIGTMGPDGFRQDPDHKLCLGY